MTNSRSQIVLAGFAILALSAGGSNAQEAGGTCAVTVPPNGVMMVVGADGQGMIMGPDGSQTPIDMSANGGKMQIDSATLKGMVNGAGSKGGVMVGPGGANTMTFKGQPIDPQQLRQRSVDALKQQLGCNDDEWSLIGPKIEKVKILQVTATSGQVLDSKDAGYDLPEAIQVRTALTEFQKIMKDENSSSARVSQALAALRDARAKARASLVQARKELTDLLTPKQEAILYQRGILD